MNNRDNCQIIHSKVFIHSKCCWSVLSTQTNSLESGMFLSYTNNNSCCCLAEYVCWLNRIYCCKCRESHCMYSKHKSVAVNLQIYFYKCSHQSWYDCYIKAIQTLWGITRDCPSFNCMTFNSHQPHPGLIVSLSSLYCHRFSNLLGRY